jgi:hypothetical protein
VIRIRHATLFCRINPAEAGLRKNDPTYYSLQRSSAVGKAMENTPNILLVNPWIAAHDLWSKPLGLLMLAGLLRAQGCQLRLLDCLDIYDPRLQEVEGMRPATRRGFGTGKFFRQQVAKPAVLEGFDRSYYRFGITPEMFQERLLEGVRPDAVLVTSTMTYWYPGVLESIRLVKEHFSDVPLILGGIYATLCREHAVSNSGADHVLSGPEWRVRHLAVAGL